jgi:hypothetical protein
VLREWSRATDPEREIALDDHRVAPTVMETDAVRDHERPVPARSAPTKVQALQKACQDSVFGAGKGEAGLNG